MRQTSRYISKALLASTALTLITAAPAARAQDTQSLAIEEILVTASKRTENVYKTPINISALASETIERQRLTNISDLSRFVPGLSLVDQGSRGSSELIVRGLSVSTMSGAEGLGNSNGDTVATYIGEVPLYLDIRMLDIERVEVLLGPQGTLYGAGTLGGAVRYLPKKPDLSTVSGEVDVKTFTLAHSSGVGFDGYGVVNIPLAADKLAIRGVFGYYLDPGFIDNNFLVRTPGVSNPEPLPADRAANLTSRKDANDESTISARVSVLGQINDNIDATLTWFYQDTHSGGRQLTHRAAFGTGPYESATRFLEPSDRKNELVTLELNWDFEWAKLTSATGYAKYKEGGQRDQTDLLLSFVSGYETFPSFVAFTREDAKDERINQELRLVSNDEGPFSWLVGGFFNRLKQQGISTEFAPGYPQFVGADRADNIEYYEEQYETVNEKAAFGEIGYNIFDWWKVTLGGRYYSYKANATSGFDLPIAFGTPTGLNPVYQSNGVSDDGFLYKVNTSFNVTPEILVYGTLSEGYRLGGVNSIPPCLDPLPPGQNVCALPNEVLIKPDQTLNKEIGVKGSALDGRTTFSLALFHINWKDIQTTGRTVNGSLPITVNGGKAVSKGVEFSNQFRLTEELTTSLTYSYTDAHLTTLAPGLVAGVDALPGDRVSASPKHQFSFALDYTHDLGNGYELGANYAVTYQSNVFTRVGLRNGGEALPGYDLHSVAVSLSKDAWKLSLYADNLFDQYAISAVRSERGTVGTIGLFQTRRFTEDVIRPRVIGLQAKYMFGG